MDPDVVVIIPARIGSTRLPDKPLALIGNQTMIEHVASRVSHSGLWMALIATDSQKIFSLMRQKGYKTIMTSANCPSGTDRVYEAFRQLPDNGSIKYVINVQGDMPFINGTVISSIIEELKNSQFDIVTSVVRVGREIALSPSNVKVMVDKNNQALSFSRSLIPGRGEDFLYHIGIYGFRIEALEKFVSLKPTTNEITEKLEQLRALDNGMTIGVCYSSSIPISVDTPEDLIKAREFIAQNPGC